MAQPRIPFKCKETFKGTQDENVIHFLDLFETQTTLARLTDADSVLLFPTCLTERAARWYHQEKNSKDTYNTYAELRAAFKACFTPSEAERKSLKVKLWALKQQEEGQLLTSTTGLKPLVAHWVRTRQGRFTWTA